MHAGMAASLIVSRPADPSEFDADWLLLARDPAALDAKLIREAMTPTPQGAVRDVPLWTDDYSDLFRILR